MRACIHVQCQRPVTDNDYCCAVCRTPQIITGKEQYRIKKQVGEGGMGVTYLAECADGRQVIAKLPKVDYDVERFQREAELGRGTHQSNRIVHTIDSGTDPHLIKPFIIQNFVQGKSLAAALKESLSPSQKLEIAHQLCEAIYELHLMNYMHRDLKPDNLMLSDNECWITIIDLGLGKNPHSPTITYGANPIMGTPLYLAPEMAGSGGYTTNVNLKTDIYSVGVILYRLFGPPNSEYDGYPYDRSKIEQFRDFLRERFYKDAFDLLYQMKVEPHKQLQFPESPVEITDFLNSLLKRCFMPNVEDRPDAIELRRQMQQATYLFSDIQKIHWLQAASESENLLGGLPDIIVDGNRYPNSKGELNKRLKGIIDELNYGRTIDRQLQTALSEVTVNRNKIDELLRTAKATEAELVTLTTRQEEIAHELSISRDENRALTEEKNTTMSRIEILEKAASAWEKTKLEINNMLREPSLIYKIPNILDIKTDVDRLLIQIFSQFTTQRERPNNVKITYINHQLIALVDSELCDLIPVPASIISISDIWRGISISRLRSGEQKFRLLIYHEDEVIIPLQLMACVGQIAGQITDQRLLFSRI